ncbi:acyltransferase [Vibrio splendidus]|uniref:acyltransferase n=1 Tax=Vibrio splendidus TaxID=29497 RepID=UPI003D0E7A7F
MKRNHYSVFRKVLSLYRKVASRVNFFKAKLCLTTQVVYTSKPKCMQKVRFVGEGKVVLGKCVQLGVVPSPYKSTSEIYIEARFKGAEVEIGNRVCINNGASIIADKSKISIGEDTLIGPNFTCFDSNFHNILPNKRLGSDYNCRRVEIGKNVFIGANVTILRGAIIGDDSVIGAGCVVNGIIPKGSIVSFGGQRIEQIKY